MLEILADNPVVAETVQDPEYAANMAEGIAIAAGAIAVGLSALAAGYAERGIGSAAVGAMAEDDSTFGKGLLLTVLPETLVIFAIVVFILVPVLL